MQKYIIHTLITLLVLTTGEVYAELRARVVIPVDSPAISAVGIIILGGTTKQVPVAPPQPRDSQSVTVDVPYSEEDKKAGALISALVSLENGSIALADVVATDHDNPDNSFSELPLCADELRIPPLSDAQLGNLKRLVEIRNQRRAVLQTKLARLMQGATLEKLRKLERGFGTGGSTPLNPGMVPYELVDRLSRLLQAIQTYERNRNPR